MVGYIRLLTRSAYSRDTFNQLASFIIAEHCTRNVSENDCIVWKGLSEGIVGGWLSDSIPFSTPRVKNTHVTFL